MEVQMKKDAYYFSHDSNSKDDPKCVMLIEQLGLEGYGIFWILVETLRDQPNYKYPLSLLPAIARRYNSTVQKVELVVKNYSLFEITEDQYFFSMSLNNRMEYLEEYRLKKSLAGKKGNAIRWDNCNTIALPSQSNNSAITVPSQNNNSAITVPSQSIASKVKKSKVKKSKVKESKVKESNKEKTFSFDSDEYKLSTCLWTYIKNNNKEAREPNFDKWSKQFDSILRIDKRKIEDVKILIKFTQQDEFWYKNILSPDKLRKHFEKLTLLLKEPKYQKNKKESAWDIKGSDYAANNNINNLEKKLLGWSNE